MEEEIPDQQIKKVARGEIVRIKRKMFCLYRREREEEEEVVVVVVVEIQMRLEVGMGQVI